MNTKGINDIFIKTTEALQGGLAWAEFSPVKNSKRVNLIITPDGNEGAIYLAFYDRPCEKPFSTRCLYGFFDSDIPLYGNQRASVGLKANDGRAIGVWFVDEIEGRGSLEGREIDSGLTIHILNEEGATGALGSPHPKNKNLRLCADGKYRSIKYSRKHNEWYYTESHHEVLQKKKETRADFPCGVDGDREFERYFSLLTSTPTIDISLTGRPLRSSELLNPYQRAFDKRVHFGIAKATKKDRRSVIAKKVLKKLKRFYHTRVEWGVGEIGSKVRQYEFNLNPEKPYDEWYVCHLFIKGATHFFNSEVLKGVPLVHEGETQRIPLIYPVLSLMNIGELKIIYGDLLSMGDISKSDFRLYDKLLKEMKAGFYVGGSAHIRAPSAPAL